MIDHTSFQAQVLARLDDDGPRAVYADRLQEAGDPRGELIALALVEARGAATPKQVRRIRELMRLHREEWLGPLLAVCRHPRLDRGFLSTVSFKRAIDEMSEEQMASVLEHPELRFVEKIHPSVIGTTHWPRIELGPMFQSLPEIALSRGNDFALAVARDRHPRAWKTLYADTNIVEPDLFAAVASSPSLRRVENIHLTVWPEHLAKFVALAREHGWPTSHDLPHLDLSLGAGFGSGAERTAGLIAAGVLELAAKVTWKTPYREHGTLER